MRWFGKLWKLTRRQRKPKRSSLKRTAGEKLCPSTHSAGTQPNQLRWAVFAECFEFDEESDPASAVKTATCSRQPTFQDSYVETKAVDSTEPAGQWSPHPSALLPEPRFFFRELSEGSEAEDCLPGMLPEGSCDAAFLIRQASKDSDVDGGHFGDGGEAARSRSKEIVLDVDGRQTETPASLSMAHARIAEDALERPGFLNVGSVEFLGDAPSLQSSPRRIW